MALNIKNEQTVDAVKRLAAFYGVTYTAAIEIAAEYVLRQPGSDKALDQALQIADDYRTHLAVEIPDASELYDESGLYR